MSDLEIKEGRFKKGGLNDGPIGERPPPPKPIAPTNYGLTDAQREAVEIIKALIAELEKNICSHDETHRGGAIWEICDRCGSKWADDEGGKPKFQWPATVERARNFITSFSSTPTPPEPPKPERKVVQVRWLHTTCHEGAVAELCIQGWEPYQVLTIHETFELLYFLKRPISGDAA